MSPRCAKGEIFRGPGGPGGQACSTVDDPYLGLMVCNGFIMRLLSLSPFTHMSRH